jgi:hypothetical protein
VGALSMLRSAVRYTGRTVSTIATEAASVTSRVGVTAVSAATGQRREPGTLRLTVLILRDEHGAPLVQPSDVEPAIALAARVLLQEAGVRLRHVATQIVSGPAPADALDPRANKLLLLDEVIGRTEYYHEQLAAHPDTGSLRDLVGRPITAIVVRKIAGRTTGCSLGISADWVVVQAGLFAADRPSEYDETVLVHELGHALNLPHHPNPDNLMYYSSSPPEHLRGTHLTGWQAAILKANRHVIPALNA